ncbi:nitrate reductase [Ferrovibrio sp.]|uniref:nitrate reductase n=1 Tax=Ferrovibrio sp. TaxID=1917215 RepID=UPI001B71A26B|nr:nitrate reductase [Ferrovibrio sp.]MBP7064481.1 molybdopterin-dependent oxidoreductase [Ferrovibrio sp.]
MTTETRTTCPYCGVGCGVIVSRQQDGALSLRGDPDHPANFGRLCSKGSALLETLSLDDRLLHPLLHGERVSWDVALDTAAARFRQVIEEYGPEAVAFYVSGQILTEDYYVANKLMKGYVGAANIDTNSRLCMASAVVGHKRAFGADTVPVNYADLELADLVVLVGSNLAWCHPVLFQRLAAARQARPEMRVVVVDPRRTMTAQFADLHLAIAPGSDVALFNGLLCHLAADGRMDAEFLAHHATGAEAALAAARQDGLAEAARATGLSATQLQQFYALFARSERVVTGFSQGVNQSSHGVDKVNAILNCHLFTGRIGRPGQGPFSITGQPNAMGGREVGGLANQLAAHMEIDNPAHRRIVQDFWASPAIAARQGLKAVDLFQAVQAGKVKAVWIAGTNPVDSMPDADAVRDALRACPFVVVSDVVRHTDTTALAHLLLPAAAWGEKDGTVTNSERRISRQRAFLPLPGEAKPDWWIFAEVARRMGWSEAFAYENPVTIFAEHAALSGAENAGSRDFDIAQLSSISPAEYDALAPFQWGGERFFADGRFYTPDGKARLVPVRQTAPCAAVNEDYPLVLNTGRVRDQWHTMTRTAKTARLMSHIAEPFVELHPTDAAALGILPASLVRLQSPLGHVVARALLSPDQRPGSVFVPLHWTGQYSAQARVDALIAPHRDALSGQPELKFTPVRALPYRAAWYGFAVLAEKPAQLEAGYWALAPAKAGWRVELADTALPDDWDAYARALFGAGDVEMLAYHDAAGAQHRFAAFRDGRLLGAFFVAPEPVAVSRAWAAEQLEAVELDPAARLRLLAGRAGAEQPDRGAIVCACFEIGVNQIVASINAGCVDVEAVGVALRAGTNCGSCRSEIRRLIDADRIQQKAG